MTVRLIAHLGRFGRTVLLSDGDIVLQPRKLRQSGLWGAVSGRVMIPVHKEARLAEIQCRYPDRHYVLIDDKPRILSSIRTAWGDRVTNVLARQGHYALDAAVSAASPRPGRVVERIGDLADLDIRAIVSDQSESGRLLRLERADSVPRPSC